MSDDRWAAMFDNMVRAFETGTFLTVFETPGRVARLPDAVGGDPKRWPLLAAPAKGKDGFFSLLQAKAHWLMLPKTIVSTLKETWRVEFSEDGARGFGDTIEHSRPRGATIRIPGASDGLAGVGYDLGRPPTPRAPVPYEILNTVYHEMTHAWLWLQEFYDAEIQKLYTDGVAAYAASKGENGTEFDPHQAFTEAAGYYVGDRIERWCHAVRDLDRLMQNRSIDPDLLRTRLGTIVDTYDTFGTYVYGLVYLDDKPGEKIKEPELSKPLRDAIDKKILDGRPLTRDFADTPLEDLRVALLNR